MSDHRVIEKKIRKNNSFGDLHKALVQGEKRRLVDVKKGLKPFCYGNMDCQITGKCSVCDLHAQCWDESFRGFYDKNTPEMPGIDESSLKSLNKPK